MYNSKSISTCIGLGFIFLICSNLIYAQNNPPSATLLSDTVKQIVVKHVIISKKDSVFINNDTLLIVSNILVREKDTLLQKSKPFLLNGKTVVPKRDTIVKITENIVISRDTLITLNEKVLRDIKEFSRRDTYISKILREIVVFRNPPPSPLLPIAPVPVPIGKAEEKDSEKKAEQEYIVRNIEIKVLDAFGYSLTDPERKPVSLLERSGNVVHLKSQRWLVKNKLRFSEGKKINALKIYESERLLRETPYIYSAKITYVPVPNTDSVDVKVVAQDVWSITGGGDPTPGNSSFSLTEVNFLGLGHQVQWGMGFNKSLPGGKNYHGSYTINNIYNSLSIASLYHSYIYGITTTGIGINREFTTSLRWVGGINSTWTDTPKDSLLSHEANRKSNQYIWAGYSTNFSNHNYKGARLITAVSYSKTTYSLRPERITQDIHYAYYNSNFYLGSIGIINRSFYKDTYIYRLGRPEDIPRGYAVVLTTGVEQRDIGPRTYLGITGTYCTNSKVGYFFLNAGLGGFKPNSNTLQEGVISGRFFYFSPLMKLDTWRWRNFFSVRYAKGYNQTQSSLVTVNREAGLRGLGSDLLIGTQKFVINYEADFIPKLDFLGFHMAWFLFTDLAWVGNNENFLSSKNFYPGYGMGIRFRNDHLIFSQIQLYIGYYPGANKVQKNPVEAGERSQFFYRGYDFGFSRPSLVPLN